MLPFLSLITGKSDNQQLCALSSPSFLLTTLPRFKVRTVAETQREFPLWRNFTFPNCGLLCPTQHTRAGRVALKTYARSRCSYRQCHITGPLWFYILSIVSAFHLGQWHNGADKKRLKGATWTIWTTPFGVLTLWPSWSLHKDRNYNIKIKLMREMGEGFRMGNTCTPVVDSCWCMAKPIQYCKGISLQLK